MSYRSPRSQRGFTLVELLTVLVVLAVVSVIAAPSFASFLQSQRVRTTSFDLVSDLLLARSEAAKHMASGTVVSVRPHEGGWATGWSVTLVADGRVLSHRDAVGTGVVFTGAPQEILFDRDGRVITTADIRISVQGDSSSEQQGSCIQLDATGRARSLRGACT
jgi:type IV fimbrial biogenesis protein FimT